MPSRKIKPVDISQYPAQFRRKLNDLMTSYDSSAVDLAALIPEM